MTHTEVAKWLAANGWTQDRHGHFHKGDRRYKMQQLAVRLERKSSAGWVRLSSGYYKHLVPVGEELAGMAR
jgi:hypothetical protein